MKLDDLEKALAGKSWTFAWDALLAVSKAQLEQSLFHAITRRVDAFIRPFSGTLEHSNVGTARLRAGGLCFGPAQLSFAGSTLRRAAVQVRVPLVAGNLVELLTGGTSAGLSALDAVSPAQGYWLQWETDLQVLRQGSNLQVVLDLAGEAREPRCNLSAHALEQSRLGEQLLAYLRSGLGTAAAPLPVMPETRFPLITLPLGQGDWSEPATAEVLTYQAGSDDDGAVLVLLAFSDRAGGSLPDPAAGLPYLVPDDQANGQRLYHAALLLRQSPYGQWLAEDQLPQLLNEARFGDQRFAAAAQRKPFDRLWVGRLESDGSLRLEPSTATLAAGSGQAFAPQAGLATAAGLWQAGGQVHGSAGGRVTQAGQYTAASLAELAADTGVAAVRLNQSNGEREETAAAWVYTQASAVLQPGRVFVQHLYGTPEALSLRAVAPGQSVQWHAPSLGRLAEQSADGSARYQPPASLGDYVAVDYVKASVASGAASESAVVLIGQAPGFTLAENYALNVAAGDPPLRFGLGEAKRADGQTLSLATRADDDLQATVVNPEGGTVVVDGDDIVYTPPAIVVHPADVIQVTLVIRGGIKLHSHIVVHTRPAATFMPDHWEQLDYFRVRVVGTVTPLLGTAYGNGYQQIQVQVEIRTGTVIYDGQEYHIPITQEELDSLELVDNLNNQAVFKLALGAEGIDDPQVALALSLERNRYVLGSQVQAPAPAAEGDQERTRRATYYIHVQGNKAYELFARFTDTYYIAHESRGVTPAEGSITVKSEPAPQPTFYLEYHPRSAVIAWKGRVIDNGENQQPRFDYGLSDASTTYYELSAYRNNQLVKLLECQVEGVPNMARWESEFWAESGFSYSSYASPSDGRGYDLALSAELLELNQALRPGLAQPQVPPASGPYREEIPLWSALRPGVTPTEGKLLFTLDQMSDMPWQWADDLGEAQVQRLDELRQALSAEVPTFRVRDEFGTLHSGTLGFRPDTGGPTSNRDSLVWQPSRALATQAAPAASVHANAFNFLSYLQGGVDPRTGQYTVALELPGVAANDLAGPELPLVLSFSPLTPLDAGFGIGWSLNLSHVDLATGGLGSVRLGNGESYRITGADATSQELYMREQKLPSFRLFSLGGNQYRLVHRDGLVEYLGNPGAGSLMLPSRIETPRGHGVQLRYEGFEGNARLASIIDDSGRVLLQLEHGSSQAVVRLDVDGSSEAARFMLTFSARQLVEMALPTEERASWRIEYDHIGANYEYLCVSELHTPVGGREVISYHSQGHGVPGNARPPLPRVASHITYPSGGGEDRLEVTYAWSSNNFLGYNALNTWSEEEDNLYVLYRSQQAYEYSSIATQVGSGVTRTVTRTYNGLHLLTEQQTEQNNHVRTDTTRYHLIAGTPVDQQPGQFQLPKAQTVTWRVGNQRQATQVTGTDYDEHGNLLKETAETGVVTTYTYYPGGSGSEACPADPWGFTRHLKTTTVAPSALGQPGAPVRVTTTTYRQVPGLASADAKGEVLPASEVLAEQGQAQALRSSTYAYYTDSADSLTLGRLRETIVTYGTFATTQALVYQKLDGQWGVGTVLKTQQTTTGHDGTTKVNYSEQSILNGLMLLERDEQSEGQDIDVRRRYDRLQRVVEETIAPGTEQEATKHYAYGLVSAAGQRGWQAVTDVKGLREVTWVDGLNRPVQVDRYEPGSQQPLQTYSATYDRLGQLASAREFDDCLAQGQVLELPERYEYDDWGERSVTVTADGVSQHDRTEPRSLADVPAATQVQIQSQQGGNLRSGVQVTWLDAFDNPLRVERYESAEDHEQGSRPYSTQQYAYDGLGRKTREIDAGDFETQFEYDAFDRNVLTVLPGNTQVIREYAAHSDQDWPTSISVRIGSQTKLLGTQAFDGLGRMTEAVTGGRKRAFTYKGGETRPTRVLTPSGATLEYQYQPRLGDQPILRSVPGATGKQAAPLTEYYDYDPLDARLVACRQGSQEVLKRQYHSNGRLKTETRLHGGEPLNMAYSYSVGERLLSYTDVVQQVQTYQYDSAGRLAKTELGSLACTLGYDALGRPASVAATDSSSRLTTYLGYDAFGREVERRFQYADGTDVLTQAYDALDRITSKTLRDGEGENAPLLRKETFKYDQRGHLSQYDCEGPEKPQDPYGHPITRQVFAVDGLDNHTRVLTSWDGGQNVATYTYSEVDPAQLVRIGNTGQGYPTAVELAYDEDGNLLNDEWGRAFDYDPLGRLASVSALQGESPSYYHYDPLDAISARSEQADGAPLEGRFYRDGQLHTLLEQGQPTTIVRAGEHLIAEVGTPDKTPPRSTQP
ncbi:RHS repeat protein [Pseudomonas typographi]|uniref:RHS repeat protein n=1 Tax=Pseudomonas typographi TaxID=2715964 RepID=UPI0016885ED7|nr:RHS repeat protein [Pseudomonas typographi]MBD1587378.1 RHS repeat protein [Pseudomonas typographi]